MIRTLARHALDLVFPPRCVSCGGFGAFLCQDCMWAIPQAVGDRCDRCWTLLDGSTCWRCHEYQKSFDSMRSTFSYGGASRDAILNLKFHGVSALAPVMGDAMDATFRDWMPPVDAVVPVPLGWVRKRTRGYNQSELIAGEISKAHGMPLLTDRIKRCRQTRPQSQQPDAESRRRNVAGAFAPTGKPLPPHVLLIDDVATTGATLDACALALLAGGTKRVFCLTFAR